jgi:nucleoside-diphosphate-sugar epimerase
VLVVLRVPGIYAADRLPLERLRAGMPVLRAEDDVYTNHIHADDLAAIALRALDEAAPAGVYNAVDDSELRMGEWFDLLAERACLPRPPRIARAVAEGRISPESLSFMSESRRLLNAKMKRALGVKLQYATVFEGVPRLAAAA